MSRVRPGMPRGATPTGTARTTDNVVDFPYTRNPDPFQQPLFRLISNFLNNLANNFSAYIFYSSTISQTNIPRTLFAHAVSPPPHRELYSIQRENAYARSAHM